MKSLKNKMLLFLILSLISFVTAYGQSTESDSCVKLDNMAYRDSFAYREIADSLNDGLDSAKTLINDQNDAINRANQTIKTQSETLDAQKSDNDKLNAQVGKLERKNKFWTNYAGLMTFIAGVSIMILLK